MLAGYAFPSLLKYIRAPDGIATPAVGKALAALVKVRILFTTLATLAFAATIGTLSSANIPRSLKVIDLEVCYVELYWLVAFVDCHVTAEVVLKTSIFTVRAVEL